MGATRQVKSLFDDPEVQAQASYRIDFMWHLTPAAPHFGELWEAAIFFFFTNKGFN